MRENGQDTDKFSAGGAVITYPASRLFEETSFLAYYLHWPHDDLLNMPHWERQEWCRRVTAINRELSDAPNNIFEV
jgi:hypothetical protein